MSLMNKFKRSELPKNGGTENPYVSAQRSWNDHVGSVTASRKMWQMVAILGLLIVLGSVAGVIHIGSQSKFVPYVVEVDKLGRPLAVAAAGRAQPVDQRVVHAALASFIADVRSVSPDVAMERKAVFRAYSMLREGNPATNKITAMFQSPETNPFKRAETDTVSIEIITVLPQTAETWEVEWKEFVRDRTGALKAAPFRMRAVLSVFVMPPTSTTTEEQIRQNPLGIYIRDYSWSKQN